MTLEHVNFFLGIAGTTLGLVLGVLRVFEYYQRQRLNLLLFATSTAPFQGLDIEVVNSGTRPVTLTAVRVSHGTQARASTLILDSRQRLPSKLEEGEQWVITLDRQSLISAVERNGVKQARYCLIWVSIETASKKVFHTRAKIDASIISKEIFLPAKEFIAADLFLGFSQLESEIFVAPYFYK